jgi:hypothetical protein
MRTERPR